MTPRDCGSMLKMDLEEYSQFFHDHRIRVSRGGKMRQTAANFSKQEKGHEAGKGTRSRKRDRSDKRTRAISAGVQLHPDTKSLYSGDQIPCKPLPQTSRRCSA